MQNGFLYICLDNLFFSFPNSEPTQKEILELFAVAASGFSSINNCVLYFTISDGLNQASNHG